MEELSADELLFFNERPGALALYGALRAQLLAAGAGRVEVKKTQISYFTRTMFAAVSFLPVRRAALRTKDFVTLTLCLPCRVDSPRVDAVSEPYPGRWTHHILLTDPGELDAELIGWIRAAEEFSARKRQRS